MMKTHHNKSCCFCFSICSSYCTNLATLCSFSFFSVTNWNTLHIISPLDFPPNHSHTYCRSNSLILALCAANAASTCSLAARNTFVSSIHRPRCVRRSFRAALQSAASELRLLRSWVVLSCAALSCLLSPST